MLKNLQNLILGLILISLFHSGVAMATNEPKFTIESKKERYEIRRYDETIIAETIVDAKFDDAGNIAFKILADYIFGNNKSKIKIDMTAPVSQQPASEKIEMTAPVNQIKNPSGYSVQFTMPDSYKMETLPEPNDKRVLLRKIPARSVAVFSYSGSWSEERYNEKLSEFQTEIKKDNLVTVGEPVFARFNSPFQIWFLRRNEIWIEVKNSQTDRPL